MSPEEINLVTESIKAIGSKGSNEWIPVIAALGGAVLGSFSSIITSREGANKRGNSSRLTQSFHFFMFEPIFFSRKCLESAYLDRFFAI
ncbi:hypothetical protein ACW5WD_20830 [Aeromonas veronii]